MEIGLCMQYSSCWTGMTVQVATTALRPLLWELLELFFLFLLFFFFHLLTYLLTYLIFPLFLSCPFLSLFFLSLVFLTVAVCKVWLSVFGGEIGYTGIQLESDEYFYNSLILNLKAKHASKVISLLVDR